MIEALAQPIDVEKVVKVAEAAVEKGFSITVQVMFAIGLLVAGYIIAGVVAKFIRLRCENIRGFDQTLTPIFTQSVRYTIIVFTLVMVLSNFGIHTTSIIAVLGAAGLAIGLALQGTLQNVAAGIMLLIIRPFRRGDYIEAGSAAGTVDETGLFMTRLHTVQGLFVAVPNSMIWSDIIINYSRMPNRRLDMQVGISYDADMDVARDVIMKVLADDERVHANPESMVVVRKLGDSSVDLELRAWTDRGDYWSLNFDVTRAVKLALDEAGISIPYPHRQIVIAPQVLEQVSEVALGKADRTAKTPPKSRTGSNKRKKTGQRKAGPDAMEQGEDG